MTSGSQAIVETVALGPREHETHEAVRPAPETLDVEDLFGVVALGLVQDPHARRVRGELAEQSPIIVGRRDMSRGWRCE